jgi:hypothetical protein
MRPIWPFPGGVDWSQFRRDDAGVDLQYPGTAPVAILAILDGTLSTAGPDPNGFGLAYPLLNIGQVVHGSTAIYYGHTLPDWDKVGKHVKQGEVIGRTGGLHSEGNAYPLSNWLEIGLWPPAGGNGVNMHDFLLTAKGSPANAPLPSGGTGPLGAPARADAQAVSREARKIAEQAKRMVWYQMQARPAFKQGWRP